MYILYTYVRYEMISNFLLRIARMDLPAFRLQIIRIYRSIREYLAVLLRLRSIIRSGCTVGNHLTRCMQLTNYLEFEFESVTLLSKTNDSSKTPSKCPDKFMIKLRFYAMFFILIPITTLRRTI